ncbi:hypothetical protein [Mesorhizobium sp. M0435]|uniref:hypothetical protein n=1 Tax=Mesorhizobium sp. M0435 TaxID=2956944 RepID=UPI003338EE80
MSRQTTWLGVFLPSLSPIGTRKERQILTYRRTVDKVAILTHISSASSGGLQNCLSDECDFALIDESWQEIERNPRTGSGRKR